MKTTPREFVGKPDIFLDRYILQIYQYNDDPIRFGGKSFRRSFLWNNLNYSNTLGSTFQVCAAKIYSVIHQVYILECQPSPVDQLGCTQASIIVASHPLSH